LENKREEQVLIGTGRWGEVTQIMYTHVSKCKNEKIKIKQDNTSKRKGK
jgi:hypothetical protein